MLDACRKQHQSMHWIDMDACRRVLGNSMKCKARTQHKYVAAVIAVVSAAGGLLHHAGDMDAGHCSCHVTASDAAFSSQVQHTGCPCKQVSAAHNNCTKRLLTSLTS
jgi:hypothetical protein